MQNKGAIKLLAIALALVSLYQLFFTYKTTQVEKAAREFANGDPAKERVYLDSVSNQTVYNFLGIAKFTYKECKELEINLGLDLKGGMNVTMEVDVADVVRSLANNSTDPAFNQAIEEARQMRVTSPKDFVTLFGEAFERIAPGQSLASPNIFGTHELKDQIKIGATNEEVLNVIRQSADGAIDNTFNILRTRIDRFGVTQPNIRKADISGRIIIELPGIKDPQRVRELLQGTAALEFYETYDNPVFSQYLDAADQRVKQILDAEAAATAKPDTNKVTTAPAKEEETSDSDLLRDITGNTEDSLSNASLEDLQKRFPLLSRLVPARMQNGQPVPGSTVGYALPKDTSLINKYLRMPQVKAVFPRDARLMWEMQASENGMVSLHAIKITTRNGKAPLEGDAVTDAKQDYDQQGRPVVSMQMNSEGAKTWARLTKENINHCIAIVLDGMVASSPVVNDEIKNGSSSISGNFTVQQAQDLANILESGKLPAPARIIADEVVGASLGKEAIQSGMWSFVIAFVLILVYMVFFYSKNAGLAADIALLANLFFLFGILASIGAVLTLPGIAGIVLTMGMAVDANVLIYERIQEELNSGKGMKLAIKEGYSHAYSAIIDGQLTTLLTGFILYYFGEGPIKGFATTLIIGILTSLFTAIFISRLILERAAKKSDNVTFTTRLTANWLRNTRFPFLSKRKYSYTISGLVILICIVSLATRGLQKGIDFVGGRNYTVKFEKPVQVDDVADQLATVFETAPEVKTVGTDNQVKITTKYRIQETSAEVDHEVDSLLYVGLTEFLPDGTDYDTFKANHLLQTQKIGPAVAEDTTRAAIWSVVFALIGIFLYIMVRFSQWQYGAGAVLGLAHNTIIVIGSFSLLAGLLPFSMEVDQAFIAAVLTVVGYTINDTVVVFDRIREYRKLYPKRDDEQTVNDALNSTLRRTFSTSLSTLVVLLAIFIFGGSSIKGFVFALLVGIAVGTYASVFIATPLSFDFRRKFAKKQEQQQVAKK